MASSGVEVRALLPLLEVSDLEVEFPLPDGAAVRAVDGVSFTMGQGEIVGLVGESGSGKSMTLMSILRLLPPPGRIVGGTITFKGRDLRSLSADEMRNLRGRDIALIPADALNSLNPVVRIGDQIREVIADHPVAGSADATSQVIDSLQRVRLPAPEARARSYPHELSGGMQQRVVIATGLLLRPDLLLADEPTTALDVTIQAQIVRLLLEIRETSGATILFVTHDLAMVAQICDRVLVMYAARLVETGPVGAVFTEPLHPYSAALIASVPPLGVGSPEALPTIPGTPPDLRALPSGCRFAPRCWLRTSRGDPEVCEKEQPVLQMIRPDRASACHFAEQLIGHPDAVQPRRPEGGQP